MKLIDYWFASTKTPESMKAPIWGCGQPSTQMSAAMSEVDVRGLKNPKKDDSRNSIIVPKAEVQLTVLTIKSDF